MTKRALKYLLINLLHIKRLVSLLSFVRLKPFDKDTSEGRAQERHRRVVLAALASICAQVIKVLSMLIVVPLTIRYLEVERYGLWLTIGSLSAFIGFADLGVGNGLLNSIADANGKNDRLMATRAVSSAIFILSISAMALAFVSLAIYHLLDWVRVFNISSAISSREVGLSMAVFLGCILINMPLGVVQRIQQGYQDGYHNSLWQGVGSFLGLGLIILAIRSEKSLPWLLLALAGGPILASLMNGVILFGFRCPWLRPRWRNVSAASVRSMIRLGVSFLMLQLSVALAFSSDNLVIARLIGAEAVTQYGVPQRLFLFVGMLSGFVLMPLWPAYGEAVARRDVAWIKQTVLRSVKWAVLITAPPCLLLVVFGKQIILWWVGTAVQPSYTLLIGFGICTILMTAGNALAMFLNGAGFIRIQLFTALMMAIGNLAISITLTYRIGIPGPIWGSIIAYSLCTLLPLSLYMPKMLNRLSSGIQTKA